MRNQPVGVPQNPTDYTGPKMDLVPIRRFPREPTTNDKKYRIGQHVIIGKDPLTGTEGELWYLARFESNGDATWLQFDIGTPGVGIDSIQTDSGSPPVGPNLSGVVGLLGGTGITTSGQDPLTDVTINIDTSVLTTQYSSDSGSATPTLGVINILGGNGLDTSATGNTVTITIDGDVMTTQFNADTGSATPSSGALNILGSNGIQTTASGNSVTINMQSPFTGDFSFQSTTSGDTEFLTVENTSNTASSSSAIVSKIAGTTAGNNYLKLQTASSDSWAIGNAGSVSDELFFLYNNDGDVSPSNATNTPMKIDQLNPTTGIGRVLIQNALVVSGAGLNSGSTVVIQLVNVEPAVNSDVEFLLQTGDPNVGAGGGSKSIRWGSANQTQFSLGQDNQGTSELEFREGGFPSGSPYFILHPGAEGNIECSRTGALTLQRGTTAQRPATSVNGMIRYNSTTSKLEGFEGGAWANLI